MDFPICCFLSGKTASRVTFTDLLASGQLTARSSFTIPNCQLSFNEVSIVGYNFIQKVI